MPVGFAHVVVVPVMFPTLSVFDVFPVTPSQVWTARTVAAGRNSIEITGFASFSFSQNAVSLSGECTVVNS